MAVGVATAKDATFRAPAVAVGRRLVSEAVWHDDRCTWFGDDVEDDGAVIHRSLAADLYGGTSGVAWSLAHLYAATGDDDVAATAAGALRHALSRTRGPTDAGLYTGTSGIALAAVAAGRLIGAPDITEEGSRLAHTAARSAVEAPSDETDLIGGIAGTALALLELSRALDDDALLDAAGTLGEHLLTRARTEASATLTQPRLCGLGHGASGAALALLELDVALDDPRFVDAARAELEVNYLGLIATTQAFAPVLAANGGGAFVNVLSVGSWIGSPILSTYSASKSAAWNFTNSARVELKRQRTHVVGVHVGFVDTDLTAALDVDKIAPTAVAAAALDAVEAGKPEAVVDDFSRQVKAGLSDDQHTLYPQVELDFAALVGSPT